jgi:hypothetical protein
MIIERNHGGGGYMQYPISGHIVYRVHSFLDAMIFELLPYYFVVFFYRGLLQSDKAPAYWLTDLVSVYPQKRSGQ